MPLLFVQYFSKPLRRCGTICLQRMYCIIVAVLQPVQEADGSTAAAVAATVALELPKACSVPAGGQSFRGLS